MSAGADAYPIPAVRRLRIYAFDPQASVELNTAVINDARVDLPWETRWESALEPGPVNDYLEVIDIDPASGVFYAPVDLNHPMLLAQNGLAPSEGRPQFHQQMVFAVAMRTIRSFERALGRGVLWAGDPDYRGADPIPRNFTRRLRIYPHALRETNAYYSPQKRALLFGYFRPADATGSGVDASWVFTCLSQDIIAHETTHAILHGMQKHSIDPETVDALAFHEAFADIVALLQHFSMTDVLKHELAQSRGSLRERGLLTGLAVQFGRTKGGMGALRYAFGLLQDDAAQARAGEESAKPPATKTAQGGQEEAGAAAATTPECAPTLAEVTEPHARGGFLVAAVFDAFVTIYERRTADLVRLARGAGDARPDGELAPELVARLASEAAKSAGNVLRMCVRALDYVPPVALRFGEYLRAIITADTDLVPDDPLRYRVAFVEAFRKRKITVPGCISMAPDSLLWSPPDRTESENLALIAGQSSDPLSTAFASLLAQLQLGIAFDNSTGDGELKIAYRSGSDCDMGSRNLRELSMHIVLSNQRIVHNWLDADTVFDPIWERLLGLRLLAPDHPFRKGATVPKLGSLPVRAGGAPLFEVSSARIARRSGPDGQELQQLIIQVVQRRRAYFDPKEQEAAEDGRIEEIGQVRWDNPDFWFRGGATVHVDLRDGRLIRIIRRRSGREERLKAERAFRSGDDTGAAAAAAAEPFAFMHRNDG